MTAEDGPHQSRAPRDPDPLKIMRARLRRALFMAPKLSKATGAKLSTAAAFTAVALVEWTNRAIFEKSGALEVFLGKTRLAKLTGRQISAVKDSLAQLYE